MTLNDPYPGFKVTPFFDAEYLRNGTTCRHIFNGILIGTYTRPTQQCHFELHWVTWQNIQWHEARAVSLQQLSFLFVIHTLNKDECVKEIRRPDSNRPSRVVVVLGACAVVTHWINNKDGRVHNQRASHGVEKITIVCLTAPVRSPSSNALRLRRSLQTLIVLSTDFTFTLN